MSVTTELDFYSITVWSSFSHCPDLSLCVSLCPMCMLWASVPLRVCPYTELLNLAQVCV